MFVVVDVFDLRAELGHGILFKLEFLSLLLRHEGKVEADTDEVALSSVITLFIIIVDDNVFTIVFSCRHVLEVIQVERVGQDVVGVDTLERLALRHHRCFEALICLIS